MIPLYYVYLNLLGSGSDFYSSISGTDESGSEDDSDSG